MKSKEELNAELAELEGHQPASTEAVDPVLTERRAHFTGAQRRLANVLSWGGKYSNFIDSCRTDAQIISDKLTIMEIIRLMLDDDGSDGVLYAVTGWNSQSKQSLADRMGDHASKDECDPRWRLGMQSAEQQRAYGKRQAEIVKVPYVEPRPELKLDAKALVHMTSEQFAEFVIEFHRQVLAWDLKQFVYDNPNTPAPQFFDGFVRLQREADAQEEALYKGAYAVHTLATDPASSEQDAEEFLDTLAWMGQRERLEAARRAERIAKQKQRTAKEAKPVVPASEAPPAWTIQETAPPTDFVINDNDFEKILSRYDEQIAEIERRQRQSGTASQQPLQKESTA